MKAFIVKAFVPADYGSVDTKNVKALFHGKNATAVQKAFKKVFPRCVFLSVEPA